MTLECHLDVAVEGAVRFELTVVNAGDGAVSLTFRDGGTADFVVLDGDREVWRWSDGRAFAQVVRTVDLASGEQFTAEGEWTDPAPGEYEAVGELRAADRDCSAQAPLSV